MRIRRALLLPLEHFMSAFQRLIPDPPWLGAASVLLGAVVSWWVYVPIHELAHVFGCIGTGGSVERLEIDAKYGAALLQRVFPFVAVGSDYAGQLTGFDTRGNDLIYLATDLAPFLLTILAGVPLLVWLGRKGGPSVARSFLLGAALPVAYAPFTNLPGDYYEMGSILVTRVTSFAVSGFDVERWRSDDLFRVVAELPTGPGRALDLGGVALSALVGLALAFATYFAGAYLGQRLVGRSQPQQPRA